MNFDEQPAMTLTEAQLAGVKRLLKDNGYHDRAASTASPTRPPARRWPISASG